MPSPAPVRMPSGRLDATGCSDGYTSIAQKADQVNLLCAIHAMAHGLATVGLGPRILAQAVEVGEADPLALPRGLVVERVARHPGRQAGFQPGQLGWLVKPPLGQQQRGPGDLVRAAGYHGISAAPGQSGRRAVCIRCSTSEGDARRRFGDRRAGRSVAEPARRGSLGRPPTCRSGR